MSYTVGLNRFTVVYNIQYTHINTKQLVNNNVLLASFIYRNASYSIRSSYLCSIAVLWESPKSHGVIKQKMFFF